LVWGVGLGCNGKVTLLLERLEGSPAGLSFAQATADQRRVACVLATVYQSDGNAGLGTCLGMAADGSTWQQAIPAAWESSLAATARQALERRKSLSINFNQLPGTPAVFFEYIAPTPRLLVLGAGDDAQPLVDAASRLGWSVIVADPRSTFATPKRFPAAREVLVLRPETLNARVTLDDHTFAVVMTHHYVHDLPFLDQLIGHPLAYLGLLGPKKRAERLLRELHAMGRKVPPEALGKLRAPVGLDLGGDAPEAVALSILAEMQAVLHQRDAAPLRLRRQPIHDSTQAGQDLNAQPAAD
jgi:xanthine dehydrogenase accessory factor